MSYYKFTYCQEVEYLIQEKFPEIKGLNVFPDKSDKISIDFQEGEYTKDEVQEFLETITKQLKR